MRQLGITPRQKTLLDFVAAYIAEHGYSPSYQEMAAGIGAKSKGNVFILVERLKQRGWITQRYGSSRSIRPVRPAA